MTTPKNVVPISSGPDTSAWVPAGRNVKLHLLDGILFIAVDTSAKAYEGVELSEKGNATIATSGGNMLIPGAPNLKLGLNVFGKPPMSAVAKLETAAA